MVNDLNLLTSFFPSASGSNQQHPEERVNVPVNAASSASDAAAADKNSWQCQRKIFTRHCS